MIDFIIYLAAIALLAAASLHVYWGLGGQTFLLAAIPHVEGKQRLPGRVPCFLVATALFFASVVLVQAHGILPATFSTSITHFFAKFWTIVFLIRGVGGLIYIRILGHQRDNLFGRMDTRIYSPLCLFLSVAFFLAVMPSPA